MHHVFVLELCQQWLSLDRSGLASLSLPVNGGSVAEQRAPSCLTDQEHEVST